MKIEVANRVRLNSSHLHHQGFHFIILRILQRMLQKNVLLRSHDLTNSSSIISEIPPLVLCLERKSFPCL
jgi:hypothetical protein